MSFLILKTFFKKSWVLVKNYWYFPVLLVYTLVMWIVFRKNNAVTLEVLKTSQDSYKKQISIINKSHEEEIAKRDAIIKEYNEVIQNIEKEYEDKKETLDKNKKAKIKEIVKRHHGDSGSMAKEIAEKFGIDYAQQ